MKTTTAMIGAALLALTAGAANAQTQTQGQTPRDRAAPVAQADFVQARVARLTAMDANNDGQVSVEEMRAARQARRAERLTARFARLDADDDGVLSKTEFEAQPAARAGREARNAPRLRRDRRMHAGQMMRPVAGAEARTGTRRAAQPIVIADVRAKAEQRFAAMDTDQDGVVTGVERQASRQAARQTQRQHRMERRAARAAAPAAPAAPSGD